MRIGIVGKPNVGKSTAFSALTQMPVDIANYPFTTIDPNVGVTWIPLRRKKGKKKKIFNNLKKCYEMHD